MTTRTTSQTITFTHPFAVRGVDGVQPAGTYTVETDDELLQALSFPARRRLETRIRLRSATVGQVARIDPDDLDAALARDLAPELDTAAEASRHNVPSDGGLRSWARSAAAASSEFKDRTGTAPPASVGEPVQMSAPEVTAPPFQPRFGAAASPTETKMPSATTGFGRRAQRAIDRWLVVNAAELQLIAVLLGGFCVLGFLMSYDLPLLRGAPGL